MGYTLIIGRDHDLCCRLVKESLLSRGRQIMYLQEERLFPGLRFAWELRMGDSSGKLGLDAQTVGFDEIDGVLARFSGLATSPEDFATKDGQYLNSEWHALMRGYIESLPCPVINRPGPELWYKSFLRGSELLSIVPDLKFRLPRTLVTTAFDDALAFFDQCGRRMCYSPLTTRSNYFISTEEGLRKLEPLSRVLPLHLSEVISGDPVDAYVVGQRIVFDGASHTSAEASCAEAAAALRLSFCHWRLARTAEDEWYCLSLDCTPNLFDCTVETRDTIIGYLIGILSSGRTRAGRDSC
jgi:hypothetical protein